MRTYLLGKTSIRYSEMVRKQIPDMHAEEKILMLGLDMRDPKFEQVMGDLSAVPIHIRRTGKTILVLAFALPLLLYALVVFLAPLDIFDQFTALRRWSDGVRSLLLGFSSKIDIYKHARTTGFPQVAMFASALAVCMVALMALTLCINGFRTYKYSAIFSRVNKVTAGDNLAAVFIFPLVGLFLCGHFFVLAAIQVLLRAIQHRVDLAIGLCLHLQSSHVALALAFGLLRLSNFQPICFQRINHE